MTDKKDISQRLQKALDIVRKSSETSDIKIAEVLHTRAKTLAIEKNKEKVANDIVEILEFVISEERYGINVRFIKQVFPVRPIIPLPGTPDFLLGITHIKGNVISVIDIRKMFGMPEKGFCDLNKIILVNYENIEIGLLAESVVGNRLISEKGIQPTLSTLKGIKSDYFRGITSDHVIILDMQKLLTDKRIIINEKI